MSRTLKGNLTGRAASTQRHEDWSNRIEADFERQRHGEEWEEKEYWPVVELLKKLDSNFEKWFWEQPEQTKGEMLPVMKRRINELLKDIEDKERDQRLEIEQKRHPY